MRQADWFFDYISPYAYLQFHQLRALPKDVEVTLRPVLFAGLLNAWGQLGPAEIPAKKAHTFLLCQWRARAEATIEGVVVLVASKSIDQSLAIGWIVGVSRVRPS